MCASEKPASAAGCEPDDRHELACLLGEPEGTRLARVEADEREPRHGRSTKRRVVEPLRQLHGRHAHDVRPAAIPSVKRTIRLSRWWIEAARADCCVRHRVAPRSAAGSRGSVPPARSRPMRDERLSTLCAWRGARQKVACEGARSLDLRPPRDARAPPGRHDDRRPHDPAPASGEARARRALPRRSARPERGQPPPPASSAAASSASGPSVESAR